MKTEIAHIVRPRPLDYQEAFQVCQAVWPYLEPLNRAERFCEFQALGVELLVARRAGRNVGVCFVLPERYVGSGSSPCDFVWLFDFAVLPEGRGGGTALLAKAMQAYPNLMVVGVTPKAAALYEALKWKRFDGLWRCVHPLNIHEMLRAHVTAQRGSGGYAIKAAASVYAAVTSIVEFAARCTGDGLSLSTGVRAENSLDEPRFRTAAKYLPSMSVRNGSTHMVAVQRAGTGRIVVDNTHGLSRFRAHTLLWTEMRARGAYLCEYLTNSRSRAVLATLLGYFPVRMPIYYRDTNGALESYIESLPRRNYDFSCCEKIL